MHDHQAVITATVAKLNEVISEWAFHKAEITRMQDEVRRHTEAQAALQEIFDKCRSTAELFGFDIDEEFNRHLQHGSPAASASMPAPAPPPATVEDFIELELVKAWPGTLRAIDIQNAYESQIRKIHPKTVGMLLYRMSKKQVVRRIGRADWQAVPPDERHQKPAAIPDMIEEAAE